MQKIALEAYQDFTGQTSAIARNLGFAGIAIVWIFRTTQGDVERIPNDLLAPTILLVAGLGCDLAQYLFGGITWGIYHRHIEQLDNPPSDEEGAPKWLNWPTNTFYWLKIACIVAAYSLLLVFLWGELR